MKRTTAVIIGAGQSGLAMSFELMNRGIDHIILERGEVANSWRHERWDSLRLLTPNRMNNLPGVPYDGPDNDGFMSVSELIDRFDACLKKTAFPVQLGTTVLSVKPLSSGYIVQTDQGTIEAKIVVMATGANVHPKIPAFSHAFPKDIVQTNPLHYKRPSDLPHGKTLVVGASASGLQLAKELQCSGRQVTLAVGNHTRMPRSYRGSDILEWMARIGVTNTLYSDAPDIDRLRRLPSPSLTANESLDLNKLQELGVELVGRCVGLEDGRVQFSGSLANICASADLKMARLLASIDAYESAHTHDGIHGTPLPPAPTLLPDDPRLSIDLAQEGYASILWATGFTPNFSWLRAPYFDRKGQLLHDGGVVAQGLYVMGLPYMRYRRSTLLHGASSDAAELANHMQHGLFKAA
ncbi:MAG: pyridine nucleotide-disulfide oxidoreductase [Boseongicola sp.]|nr:MAG: pyridine nucleotide-disulfide oxidoreductase [Boseongicola sp.]